MSILIQILVSFVATGVVKAKTRLNGTRWLNVVNGAVSVLGSMVKVWQSGSTDDLEMTLNLLASSIMAYAGAWLVHKLVKNGYIRQPKE